MTAYPPMMWPWAPSTWLRWYRLPGVSSTIWAYALSIAGWRTISGPMRSCAGSDLLIRVAENRTGETWAKMRARLERMRLGECRDGQGRVLRRSETTPQQRGIFKALGIPKPPHFHLIEVPATRAAA